MVLNPQFIKDSSGNKLVVLHQGEFERLLEQLEDLEDLRLYREAKKSDTGERIPMEEAFKIIEAQRASNSQ